MLLYAAFQVVSRPDIEIVIFCAAQHIHIPKRHWRQIPRSSFAQHHSREPLTPFGYPVGFWTLTTRYGICVSPDGAATNPSPKGEWFVAGEEGFPAATHDSKESMT